MLNDDDFFKPMTDDLDFQRFKRKLIGRLMKDKRGDSSDYDFINNCDHIITLDSYLEINLDTCLDDYKYIYNWL